MNDRSMLVRFGMTALLYLLLASGLGFRLAFLHLGPHEARRDRIEHLRQYERELRGRRGAIYDRGGNILALDRAVKDVCADPDAVLAADALPLVASRLAALLGLDVDEVAVRLNRPGRRYERIMRWVEPELAERVMAEALPGVYTPEANMRYYPHGDFMCHVLGFVNHEGDGSAGIEQALHTELEGRPGVLQSRVDARRQELYLERERFVPGQEGNHVELTIDQNIQHIVEKVMDQLVEEYQPEGAWCIVQHVRTGEILAMVSRPAYDLNTFNTTDGDVRLNRAIGVNFEPGSTLKAAAFAAALNEGIVTPETVFDCENGGWYYKGSLLRDHSPYGKLTVAEGLRKSSNILTAKMSLMLGNERLYRYLREFGLGQTLGIELPGEQAGIFHQPSRWYGISPTRIPIGQGVATTALQVLGIYATIANDGYRMRPCLVRRIKNGEGQVLYEAKPEAVARVIRPETAALMRELLAQVTESGGTGRRAAVAGMRVAGKTGTAQKPVPGGYSPTDYIASFVGFAPADDPEISIIVVVDTPGPVYGGGRVAAPAFSLIAGEVIRYMGIDVENTAHRGEGGRFAAASDG